MCCDGMHLLPVVLAIRKKLYMFFTRSGSTLRECINWHNFMKIVTILSSATVYSLCLYALIMSSISLFFPPLQAEVKAFA